MRLKEQKLWDRMRSHVQYRQGVSIQRLENMVTSGMPDLLMIRNKTNVGRVSLTELKCAKAMPKRNTTRLLSPDDGLSTDQRNWHLNWTNHRGTSFIVIGVEYEDIYWCINGALADSINNASILELDSLAAARGPSKTFWDDYINLL